MAVDTTKTITTTKNISIYMEVRGRFISLEEIFFLSISSMRKLEMTMQIYTNIYRS